ncbi:MAG: hypothetical protein L6R00_17280 [Phycisphaerae bacterium]|nr:hypothetical protein [Phycisphaerae bacterium]
MLAGHLLSNPYQQIDRGRLIEEGLSKPAAQSQLIGDDAGACRAIVEVLEHLTTLLDSKLARSKCEK